MIIVNKPHVKLLLHIVLVHRARLSPALSKATKYDDRHLACSCGPTDPFETIKSADDVPILHKIDRSPEFAGPKLWKGRSGGRAFVYCYVLRILLRPDWVFYNCRSYVIQKRWWNVLLGLDIVEWLVGITRYSYLCENMINVFKNRRQLSDSYCVIIIAIKLSFESSTSFD